jgi:hypothetical protein
MSEKKIQIKENLFQLFVAIDQVVNVLLGMIFKPYRVHFADETISSASHRRRLRGKPFNANLIDKIFFFQPNHCEEAYNSERERAHCPPQLRPNADND